MIAIPTFQTGRFRLAALLIGVVVFFWLRVEDDNAIAAAVCAFLSACLIVTGWAWRKAGGRSYSWRRMLATCAALGGLVGLGTAASAALLMLIKNGLHGHLFPDFPFGMIAGVLALAPIWTIGGGLVGLGIGAVWVVRKT